jgi:hypothetical protein
VRDKWTDERLDDGFRHVDARFDRMEEQVDEPRSGSIGAMTGFRCCAAK